MSVVQTRSTRTPRLLDGWRSSPNADERAAPPPAHPASRHDVSVMERARRGNAADTGVDDDQLGISEWRAEPSSHSAHISRWRRFSDISAGHSRTYPRCRLGATSCRAHCGGGTYRRHEPEHTVLYGVVQKHLDTFLAQARGPDGDGYPHFLTQAFRRFLACRVPCHRYARLRCAECRYERLLRCRPLATCVQAAWRAEQPTPPHS